MLPRISIVTPCFNSEDYIEETICSVLSQDYPNLQYIVIDGGSTDGTLSILNKYSSYIDIIISEPDNGQSHAISKGLQLCDGYVFNWLNSDDTYTPNALKTVGTYFGDPATNVLCGHSHIYDRPHEAYPSSAAAKRNRKFREIRDGRNF